MKRNDKHYGIATRKFVIDPNTGSELLKIDKFITYENQQIGLTSNKNDKTIAKFAKYQHCKDFINKHLSKILIKDSRNGRIVKYYIVVDFDLLDNLELNLNKNVIKTESYCIKDLNSNLYLNFLSDNDIELTELKDATEFNNINDVNYIISNIKTHSYMEKFSNLNCKVEKLK